MQKACKICQSTLKIVSNKTLKILPFKLLPKWGNFVKSSHTGYRYSEIWKKLFPASLNFET